MIAVMNLQVPQNVGNFLKTGNEYLLQNGCSPCGMEYISDDNRA